MNCGPKVFLFALLYSCALVGAREDLLSLPAISGRHGGRLVYSQRAAPRTLNPIFASDAYSRELIQRLNADGTIVTVVGKGVNRVSAQLAISTDHDDLHRTALPMA